MTETIKVTVVKFPDQPSPKNANMAKKRALGRRNQRAALWLSFQARPSL